jgi:hypothetical protein
LGRSLAGLVPILLALAVPAGATEPADTKANESAPVLVLSHEHLGMTAEQIEASQAALTVESAPVEPVVESEFLARADAVGADAREADAPVVESEFLARADAVGADAREADALEAEAEMARQRARQAAERAEAATWAARAAEAGLIPGIGENHRGPASYETCVEALIRHGDSYGKSTRTCGAVFGATDAAR